MNFPLHIPENDKVLWDTMRPYEAAPSSSSSDLMGRVGKSVQRGAEHK